MTWGEAMVAALVATLRRGRWWIVALATFLVRGGLVALLPAIVLVPTPAELALHLDPSLTGDAPGNVTSVMLEIVVRVVVGGILVLLLTTAIGARIETELVIAAAAEVADDPPPAPSRRLLGRAIVARLVTHIPTFVAVVLGGLGLTNAAYGELVSPSGPGSLVGRVVGRAPVATLAIVVTWLLGETWGGLAVRHLVAGDPLARALGISLVRTFRRSGLATILLTGVVVALPAAVLWVASARAFERLWPLVVDRADPWAVVPSLGLLVGTWGAGLAVLGIALAFRSAAWTTEALRMG